MQFDPEVTTYEALLEVFWSSHNYVDPIKRQYKSAIFYNNEQQRIAAEKSLERVKRGELGKPEYAGKKILTVIEPATDFHVAEIYHQKYILQCNHGVMDLLNLTQYSDLGNGHVVTRLNGYLAGHGDLSVLIGELHELAIPLELKVHLLRVAAGGKDLASFDKIDDSNANNPLPQDFLSRSEISEPPSKRLRTEAKQVFPATFSADEFVARIER
jgi:peptide-methionine (S)-S-oxide reductase